ncbi:PAS domain-containing sensor histidine kinase [Mucilaginibacter auburnensis]|uniref:Oxygen sensor histidine kinase NreB n=1 Tax=Mucilaginibacter auburnensis TaxID=1457233 RepID=A0A2H9VRP1_9SPHI|nr:PAS domain S-box protein [Mucilaginibacter auburnensis]PJJ83497.1 PAS domain S-box-containing protein [Mucilaginibacter auburnensis]
MSDTSKIRQLEAELHQLRLQVKHTAQYQAGKHRLEKDYQLSQNGFRTIFERSAIGKNIINSKLEIVNINQALLTMLGYSEEEILGNLITDFTHPDFVERWQQLQRELWSTDLLSFNFETCMIRKNGTTFWGRVTAIPIEDDNNKFGYLTLEDTSEKKELERLQNLVEEQILRQQLAETVFKTQEAERRRMAESLHNGLGQLLYGAKLSLNQLKANANEGANEIIEYTQKLLNDCIRECRSIAHNLTPPVLQELGLKQAVVEICKQLTDSTHFKCDVNRLTNTIDNFLEVAIYRMIQELMINIVKHADASEAFVYLSENDSQLIIRVEDNGKGFNQKNSLKKGIGIQTIRYKVALLSGKLSITSEKGKGTKVKISLPKKVA